MDGSGATARDHAEINRQLEAMFALLSPQLKRAARYVLDRPEEVALRSMRQLAGDAGVTPATMLRLAQALEFPGFDAFREPFREHVRRPGQDYADRVRALQARAGEGQDHEATLVAELAAAEQDNLRRSFETVGYEGLAAAAGILAEARRVYVVGLRSCYAVAFYIHYACGLFRNNVALLDGRGGTLTDGLRGIGSEDAMLSVGFAPYTRDTVELARYAGRRGARLIAITDSTVSPLASHADSALIVANDSPALFRSLVSAMAVAQALVALLMSHGGEDALAAVGESETLLHDFRAYWEETPPWTARQGPGRGEKA
ncbi:MAG: MurR/RpiR family transcriptional regulator [Alphaproteobacteria bacterium]|nr:MurR/RpiR family transcriptional regulator [Alphaproteobacteria bacterium]